MTQLELVFCAALFLSSCAAQTASVTTKASSQTDIDQDGLNDSLEVVHRTDAKLIDTDRDSLTDGSEVHLHGTNPMLADTDGDQLIDGDEIVFNTSPLKPDTDGDQLSDHAEMRVTHTNPTNADMDGDSFFDGVDDCPRDAGPDRGCPAFAESSLTMVGLEFEPGASEIVESHFPALKKAREILSIYQKVRISIEGHTYLNESGDDQSLSLSRAHSVRNWLIQMGIAAERLTVAGYGSARPITTNSTAEGRALNSRIEFIVIDN